MPKDYFQMVPSVNYDISGDGTTKVAIDILRRTKLQAEALLDGAIFYNYTMQDGDNAEIIADKYYGSSKYHWVVLLMNDILDHTYDFTLNDNNFERYINAKYGSMSRAYGISVNLSSTYTSTLVPVGPRAGIKAEWHSTEFTYGPDPSVTGANTGIISGSFPEGNSTAIFIRDVPGSDPFSVIDVGDIVNLFVPEDWYDQTSESTDSGYLSQDSGTNPDNWNKVYLSSNASFLVDHYVGGVIEIKSEGTTGTTKITGNTRTITAYDRDTKIASFIDAFADEPQGNTAGTETNVWGYEISYPTPQNYPLISYTTPSKVIGKSVYRTGEVDESGENWVPDSQNENRYFQLNLELNSNTFKEFSWDRDRELVSIRTGIHHFGRDIYGSDTKNNIVLLAENVYISQDQYVNTAIGTASTKGFVTNLDFEADDNENKRVIYLLKRQYLDSFVEEFKTLMGVSI